MKNVIPLLLLLMLLVFYEVHGQPPAPINLSVSNVTSSSFTASWSASTGAFDYRIDAADNFEFSNPILNNDTVLGTTRDITGLLPNKFYRFRVRAVDAAGRTSGNSQTFFVTTLGLPPVVTSFSPASGPAGTSVTITCSNFEPTTPAKNFVFFGATGVRATAGTSTTLTAIVPPGATFEPIRVLNTFTRLSGYSATPFVLTFTPSGQTLRSNSFGPRVSLGNRTEDFRVMSAIETADFNADNKPDLITKIDFGSNSTAVFVHQNQSLRGNLNADSFAPPIILTSGPRSGLEHVTGIDDLNGDGRPDIVFAFSDRLMVFINTSFPGGILSFTKLAFNIPSIIAMDIGDLDGDGRPDLAVANSLATGGAAMTIFHNNYTNDVTKIFTTPGVSFPVRGNTALAIGDLDNDQKPEIVVGNVSDDAPDSAVVSVFRNVSVPGSPASFAPKIDFPFGEDIRSIAICDLDHNGKKDLAVGSYNYLSVFDNTGTGPFSNGSLAPKVDYRIAAVQGATQRLSLGDLNGDTRPELIANGFLFENRSVAGSGRSTFAPHTIFLPDTLGTDSGTVSLVMEVAACDLDGDGKTDLVAASKAPQNNFYETIVLHNNLVSDSIPDVFLTTPVSGTTGLLTTVDVTAKALSGASTYTIQVSPREDFSTGVIEKVGSRAQRFTGLAWGTRYYARVKTNLSEAFGKTTEFSTVRVEDLSFVTSPADGAIDQNPNLNITCNSVPGAAQYTIELDTSPDFNADPIVKTGARTQSFTGLTYNKVYYSRVRTEFTQNWGPKRSFTVTDASRISFVVSPADGATGQPTTLNLVCGEVPGATQFTIRLTSPLGDDRTFTSASRSIRVSGLAPNMLYQTEVKTDQSLNFGPPRTFTTAANPLVAFPNPVSRGQFTINNTTPGSQIKIVDARSGALVATIPVEGEEVTIKTTDFRKGLYNVMQVSADGSKGESLNLIVE